MEISFIIVWINGAGDSLSVIFTEKLVLVKGFAHESALNLFAKEQEESSVERMYAGLPEEYQSLFSPEEKRERLFSFGMTEKYIKIP